MLLSGSWKNGKFQVEISYVSFVKRSEDVNECTKSRLRLNLEAQRVRLTVHTLMAQLGLSEWYPIP
jgi:hypothetical protein